MKRVYLAVVGSVVLALAGCGGEKGSSTAPPKAGTDTGGKPRTLTVKAPGDQSVVQDKTTEFKVSVTRDKFDGPVTVAVTDLPKGVSLVTTDMTVPAGKDSLAVTVKAAADAPAVKDHVVKVAAKTEGMPDAEATFKLDVKAK